MEQNPNQRVQTTVKGKSDLGRNYNTVPARADTSITLGNELVAGQFVKIVNATYGIPRVLGCDANDDDVFGVVAYNIKDSKFKADQALEIFMAGNCVYVEANGPIERGTNVSLDVSEPGLVGPSSGFRTHLGWAYDRATTKGQLIRMIVGESTRNELLPAEKGNLDLTEPGNTFKAVAAGALKNGEPVEMSNTADAIPRVTKCNDTSDTVAGYVIKTEKTDYAIGDTVYIATTGAAIWLASTAAIARNANVCLDLGEGTIAPSATGRTIVGFTKDRAGAAAAIVRVKLDIGFDRTA